MAKNIPAHTVRIKYKSLLYTAGLLFGLLLTAGIIRNATNVNQYSQTCFSRQQVASDNRCLYVLNNDVYEQGTKAKPHKGHPCGMDVTSIIPSFHQGNVAKYLTPNYRGKVCAAQQPTAVPTVQPTATRVPTTPPTRIPTAIPTSIPTQTPLPTATRTPSPTQVPLPSATRVPSPTVTKIPSPTVTRMLTPIPSVTAVIIPTNTPFVAVPTATLVPTQIIVVGNTSIHLALSLHGIGKAGDSANTSAWGNNAPLHTQRIVNVEISNATNQLITSNQGMVTFNSTSGNFEGDIDLGGGFSGGSYSIKVKTPQYIQKEIGGSISLTAGGMNQLQLASLVVGDINDDNALNVLDYNQIIQCYSDTLVNTTCSDDLKQKTDINDDGAVNGIDYNLFLREIWRQ